MIFKRISTLFIILVNFIYSSEQFPPVNISPTFSNAKELNFIKKYHHDAYEFQLSPIVSEFRNIHRKRENLSSNDVAHLLRRTTFGPVLEEIELGAEMAIDDLLDILFTQNAKPLPSYKWIFHPNHPDFNQLSSTKKDSIRDSWEENYIELQNWWLQLMDDSGMNITEMMVLFWHDHFATSAQVIKFTPSMYLQNQLVRKYAIGNFKDLVKSINYDPAMLQWLDNDQNYFVNENNFTFNENYARELLELFTMGEGNYTQTDIEESARALTGISTDGLSSVYSPTRHDYGIKTIFGETEDIGVDGLIDIIFEQPEPALFICRKLYKWFVYEIPDEDIVEQMAEELIQNNYEIEPVLRLLFLSEHFYDINFRGAKYKNPVWFSLSTFRQLYTEPENRNEFILWYNWILGQAIFHPPDVSGWDGYRSWVNTYTLPYRKLFSNQVVDGHQNLIPEWGNVIEFAERFSEPNNPELLVIEMADYLLAIQPSPQTIDLLIEELLDGSEVYDWYLYNEGSEQRFKTVIKHIMRLEEFQLR